MAVDIMELERKITKFGNSTGVVLPKEVLEHTKMQQGDNLKFTLQEDGSVVIKKAQKLDMESMGIDQEFLSSLNYIVNKYDTAIKNLSKR